MRQEKGITMVSLVVTIIILIILAGISVNTLIGDNGIIAKTKQAKQNITLAGEAEAMQLNQLYYELETGGELTEDEESSKKDEIISLLQKQVEELQKQVATLQTENEELKKQIQELTEQIANLQQEIESLKQQITNKDIEIAELKKQVSEKEAKIQELQNQLNSLNSLLSQTNATADKILTGYKAYSGGKLLTGTMVNRGAVSSSLNCGQSYTIPAGYHNGSGKVTANSLASQTVGTATANNLSNGVTAWVNGVKITGNGTDVNNSYQAGSNDASTGKYTLVELGTGTSFDIKSVYSNYSKLTTSNFICQVVSISVSGSATDNDAHNSSYSGSFSVTPSITYNSSTGIVNISGTSNSRSYKTWGNTGTIITATATVKVYLKY
ncbi:MAG: hypothetical protein ACLS95_02990 [Clostridia bacterium]